MGVYIVGEVIRCTRESLGISCKELCDGICAIETLYRIENGQRAPNRTNFRALMERMGKSGEKYLPFIRGDELDIMEKGKELDLLLTSRKFEELNKKLVYLKYHISLEDNVNRQFILRLQALVNYEMGKINEGEKRAMLVEALLYTVPNYQDGMIPRGIFTRNEIMLLCNIAVSYAQEKNFEIALNMLRQIENYFDTKSIDMEERAISETLALSNLVQCLGQNGDIEEAIKKGKKAIELCIKTRKGGVLSNLLYNIAYGTEALHYDEKLYKKWFMQAYYVAELNDDMRSMMHIKKHMDM